MLNTQKPLQVAAAVIKNPAGQILISLRDKSLHQGGLWEFPGGKIEHGETPLQALARELKEELDIIVTTATPLITVSHQYPDLAVQLHVYLVEDFSGVAKSCEGQPLLWVSAEGLTDYSFPSANQPIITAARLPAYYAILDDADEALLIENLQKILNKGVRLIQARLKRLSSQSVNAFLAQAYPLCKQSGALLLMNSAVKLTEQGHVFNDMELVGRDVADCIDGIHLTGQHLMAKSRRPEQVKWLSASCHNLAELQHAQKLAVDFAVLAPVFPTKTHPGVLSMGWDEYSNLVAQVNIPIYALGGLTQASLNTAREAGGQGIAGISAFL